MRIVESLLFLIICITLVKSQGTIGTSSQCNSTSCGSPPPTRAGCTVECRPSASGATSSGTGCAWNVTCPATCGGTVCTSGTTCCCDGQVCPNNGLCNMACVTPTPQCNESSCGGPPPTRAGCVGECVASSNTVSGCAWNFKCTPVCGGTVCTSGTACCCDGNVCPMNGVCNMACVAPIPKCNSSSCGALPPTRAGCTVGDCIPTASATSGSTGCAWNITCTPVCGGTVCTSGTSCCCNGNVCPMNGVCNMACVAPPPNTCTSTSCTGESPRCVNSAGTVVAAVCSSAASGCVYTCPAGSCSQTSCGSSGTQACASGLTGSYLCAPASSSSNVAGTTATSTTCAWTPFCSGTAACACSASSQPAAITCVSTGSVQTTVSVKPTCAAGSTASTCNWVAPSCPASSADRCFCPVTQATPAAITCGGVKVNPRCVAGATGCSWTAPTCPTECCSAASTPNCTTGSPSCVNCAWQCPQGCGSCTPAPCPAGKIYSPVQSATCSPTPDSNGNCYQDQCVTNPCYGYTSCNCVLEKCVVAGFQFPTGRVAYVCVPKGLEASDPSALAAGAQILSTGTVPANLCANTAAASTAADAQNSLSAVPTGTSSTVAATGHCSVIILALQSAPTANSDGSTTATVYVNLFNCPTLSGPDSAELDYLCGQLRSVIGKYAPSLRVTSTSCALTPTAAKKRSVQEATYNYQATLDVAQSSSFGVVPVASLLTLFFVIMFAWQ